MLRNKYIDMHGQHNIKKKVRFNLWFWMKNEADKRRVDTPEELLAGIFDAAARMRNSEDQLRRTTRDLHTHTGCKVR